jgi:hypothetical protein
MSVIFFDAQELGNLAGALSMYVGSPKEACEALAIYSDCNAVAYAMNYGKFDTKGFTAKEIEAAIPTSIDMKVTAGTSQLLNYNGPSDDMFGDDASLRKYKAALKDISSMATVVSLLSYID